MPIGRSAFPGGQSVRNEANLAGRANSVSILWKSGYDEWYTQEALARRSQFPAGPGGTGPVGPRVGGRLCKTKPIPGGARWTGLGGGSRGGQFCETKPICEGLAVGHAAPRLPLWLPAIFKPIGRNEANSSVADWGQTCGPRPAQGDRAKRTQFRPSAGTPEDETCETKPILQAWPTGCGLLRYARNDMGDEAVEGLCACPVPGRKSCCVGRWDMI